MKRTLDILLAAVVLVGGLVAFLLLKKPATETPPPAIGSPAVTEPAAPQRNLTAILAKHDPSEVVMTIDGSEVTWGEYFYTLSSVIPSYESYFGPVEDWDAVSLADIEGQSVSEYLKAYMVTILSDYHIMDKLSAELGVTLTEADLQELAAANENLIATYGGGDEAAFNEYLASLNLPPEVFQYMNEAQYLYYNCFAARYGETGEKTPDADVQDFADAGSYIRVKHVLISTKDDAGADLDEAAKAEKLAQAQEVLARLQAAEDKDAEIDACIAEFSTDPGHAYYPDGYTMTYGEMDPAFETAAYALEDGQVSDIVETAFGYHILLRLPLKFDGVMSFNGTEFYSMRYMTAVNAFSGEIQSRKDSAVVEYLGDFVDLHLGKLLEV